MTRNKYHARKVEADGFLFDSQAEYLHYLYLRSEQDAGRIMALVVHPTYTLLPKFKTRAGKWEQPITYTPDFQYIEQCDPDDPYTQITVCEDVKGVATKDYVLRRKLFQYTYPDILFREVKV